MDEFEEALSAVHRLKYHRGSIELLDRLEAGDLSEWRPKASPCRRPFDQDDFEYATSYGILNEDDEGRLTITPDGRQFMAEAPRAWRIERLTAEVKRLTEALADRDSRLAKLAAIIAPEAATAAQEAIPAPSPGFSANDASVEVDHDNFEVIREVDIKMRGGEVNRFALWWRPQFNEYEIWHTFSTHGDTRHVRASTPRECVEEMLADDPQIYKSHLRKAFSFIAIGAASAPSENPPEFHISRKLFTDDQKAEEWARIDAAREAGLISKASASIFKGRVSRATIGFVSKRGKAATPPN